MNEKIQIIAIDDCKMTRISLKKLLESKKYEFHCFDDGYQFMEFLQDYTPDIIILDIVMPVVNGYELFKEIKKIDHLRNCPIIFLTSETGPEKKLIGYRMGSTHYIEKPFDGTEFLYIIRNVTNLLKNNINAHIDFLNSKRVFKYDQVEIKLSPTEYSILKILYFSKRNNILLESICNSLSLTFQKEFSPTSFHNHLSKLRKKLAVQNIQIISTYGEGYSLKLPEITQKANF